MENQNTFHKGDYIIIQEELDSYGIAFMIVSILKTIKNIFVN